MSYRRRCYFSRKGVRRIDYTDAKLLLRFTGTWGKLKAGRETGNCAKHQRMLAEAMKRARYLAIVPYTSR